MNDTVQIHTKSQPVHKIIKYIRNVTVLAWQHKLAYRQQSALKENISSMYNSGDDSPFRKTADQLRKKSNWQYHLLERKVSQESGGMCLLNSQLIAHFQLQLLFGSIILSLCCSCTHKQKTQSKSSLYFKNKCLFFLVFFFRKCMCALFAVNK